MAKRAKPDVFADIEPWPTDAWGLSRVPSAFASSPRAAALLGLGYPHVILPSTTPREVSASEITYERVVPRSALVPTMRDFQLHVTDDLAAAIERVLTGCTSAVLWMLEAHVGSVPLANAMVAKLEALPIETWYAEGRFETEAWLGLRSFAWVLCRVPEPVRANVRERLAALWTKVSAHGSERLRPTMALDVIVNGRAGVERSGERGDVELRLEDLPLADDDPDWVARTVIERLKKQRSKDAEQFDIQLAVVGGPKVLAALRDSTKKFTADQRYRIELQLSLCA